MNHKRFLFPLLPLMLVSCGGPTSVSNESSSSSSTSSASRPGLRKGYVKADGEKLLDGEGKQILLRGTNAGGMFVHERWMSLTDSPDNLYTINALTDRFDREDAYDLLDLYADNFWTDEDFKNVKDLGINCLRLPISYMDVFDCDFELLRSDDPDPKELEDMALTYRKSHIAKIDSWIDNAERNGLYVILDLHGAFGSQNGNDHSIDSRNHDWLWRQDELGAAFRDLTLQCWEVLAEHYASFQNIAGYDILNEPAGDSSDPECVTSVTGRIQWDYFDELYKVIRHYDKDHLIIMESCWGADNLPMPTLYGWENIMYEFHHYENSGTWDDEFQVASFNARVRDITSASFGIPLYMGEFCPHCSYQGWARVLEAFNANHISWTTWTYKVRGFSDWGLYNIRTGNEEGEDYPVSEIARIARGNDDYKTLERKWGKAQRDGVVRNDGLCEVIALAAKAPIA